MRRHDEDSVSLRTENEAIERFYDNPVFDEERETVTLSKNEEKPLVTKSFGKSENYQFLLILDAVLIVVEYLQMFALLQSLSLRWTWPIEWTKTFSFLFIFNLDIWELAKLATPNAYVEAQDYLVPSADVPIDYRVLLLCWLIVLVIGTVVFFVLQWKFTKSIQPTSLNKLRTAYVIILQILALPIGVQIGKLFWCRPFENTLDTENTLTCWTAEHSIYVVLAIIVAVALYIAYPILLVIQINSQIITKNARKHEMYMRLKHCEHLYGLNSSWNEQLYFIFGSFRRFWVFHRPIAHLLKFSILCFYAAAFSNKLVQISLIFGILGVWLIVSLVRLPYLVTSYNFAHAWGLACLTACAVIGTMKNIDGLESVFLLPTYLLGELILINTAWLVGICIWIVFIVLRMKGVIWRKSSLWPALLKPGRNGVTENTERYIEASVEAKKSLDRARSVPALLSPVHELAHHTKVLNALACEAEYIRDPLQSTLRDVLDDVIQLHNKQVGVSIFTESIKAYVQTTVTNLIEMLPAFSRRLQQREFDLILVSSTRRRMLLKMYAVACFLQAGREKSAHERGVRKLWRSPSFGDVVMDEGFHDYDDVIVMNDIKLSTRPYSRPVSVQSYRKSEAAVLPVAESVA